MVVRADRFRAQGKVLVQRTLHEAEKTGRFCLKTVVRAHDLRERDRGSDRQEWAFPIEQAMNASGRSAYSGARNGAKCPPSPGLILSGFVGNFVSEHTG